MDPCLVILLLSPRDLEEGVLRSFGCLAPKLRWDSWIVKDLENVRECVWCALLIVTGPFSTKLLVKSITISINDLDSNFYEGALLEALESKLRFENKLLHSLSFPRRLDQYLKEEQGSLKPFNPAVVLVSLTEWTHWKVAVVTGDLRASVYLQGASRAYMRGCWKYMMRSGHGWMVNEIEIVQINPVVSMQAPRRRRRNII